MLDILNIEGLMPEPEKSYEDRERVVISISRRPNPEMRCRYCGAAAVPNGTRAVEYMDLPVRGKPTTLKWDRQRYICLNIDSCRKSFSDDHEDLHPVRQMTWRLFNWIGQRSIDHTFVDVAADVGLSERAVSSVFREWSEAQFADLEIITPRVLGLDEVHLLHRARLVLINHGTNTVIDMREKHTNEAVAAALGSLSDPRRVRVVTIDMTARYKNVIEEMLPQAMIVVDKFHVVKEANNHLETIRKSLRSGLPKERRVQLLKDRFLMLSRRKDLNPMQQLIIESWTNEFPQMKEAYDAKEAFFDIWNHTTEKDARAAYMEWQRSLSTPNKAVFQPLINSMGRWHKEVFNYFRVPVSNGPTEAENGLIKIANRTGRGYSFETLKAKVMLDRRAWVRRGGDNDGKLAFDIPGPPPEVRFGVNVPTLERVLREDHQ
ncbi:ISL3 family transposase [Microvirga vignae]|uniref:ISL3 family transposase n=1 Tax=Microvirga vignae TaxID=1225564 RepID=UPI00069B566D|nr:ISL3 family transposase [Microvirga vignae]